MTIIELLAKGSSPPDGYDPWCFRAMKPDGSQQTFCRASFLFDNERNEIIKQNPDVLNWKVTEEYLHVSAA